MTDRLKWILAILVLHGFSLGAFTQVKFVVKDKDKNPLPGATVQMYQVKDSATAYFGVADAQGQFIPNRVKTGPYEVSVSFVGYKTVSERVEVGSKPVTREYFLEEEVLDLGEVTVTARRPLLRQEDDKTIIDPTPLANISTNTLEILEKTPGVFVDQDGYIYLSSTNPAQVYINGREQRMSAQDMAGILRSLPPDNIEKIEVLRTPSTKYDASSSGGIVNVVLKKGVRIGRTGSVNMGINQGVYGNRFAGFNYNDSNDKSTYYLRANLSTRDQLDELNSFRKIAAGATLDQQARTRLPGTQDFLGFGISHDPSEKWNVSYDSRINWGSSESFSSNINRILSAEQLLVSENDNRIENHSRSFGIQQDLGAKWKIDSLGSEWDTRFSYSYNDNGNDQEYRSEYLFPAFPTLAGDGNNAQGRHFFQLQSDLILQLPHKIKLETGFKTTYQAYDSRSDYFLVKNSGRIKDPFRTNAFNYRENIHAAYLQASKTLPGNFTLKTGTRMEYTYMKGLQTVPADTGYLIRRVDFFPYVYLSRSVAKIAKYELRGFLIFRRTINRPGYQNLNPYVRYIDQFLYETGNPGLQPQFTDNYEANISFDERPIFAVGRNLTRSIFSPVIYQDPQLENVAVRTFDNVGSNKETYFRMIGAIPPGGKYFFVVGAQYNLTEYQGLYENRPLTFTRGSWRLFSFHQLSLGRETKLTLSGFMLLRGQQNFYELNTFGQLNIGLNQTFFNKKLNVTLNASDVLRTMVTRFSLNQGGITTFGDRYGDNQRIGLNLRYQFGLRKKEEERGGMPLDVE